MSRETAWLSLFANPDQAPVRPIAVELRVRSDRSCRRVRPRLPMPLPPAGEWTQ